MMYEELVAQLREIVPWECFLTCKNTMHEAADAIDKLVKICNSILSKYEEAAEAVIYEYSGHIDEDIDELHKEIEDYKAQINGVAEPPKEASDAQR